MMIPLPFFQPMDARAGLELNDLMDYLFIFFLSFAYTIFLLGFIRLLNYFQNKEVLYSTLPFTCLILVISCLLRPNLTSSSFFLLLLPIYDLLKNKNFKR